MGIKGAAIGGPCSEQDARCNNTVVVVIRRIGEAPSKSQVEASICPWESSYLSISYTALFYLFYPSNP